MTDLRKNFQFDNIELISFVNLNSQEKKLIRNWRNHPEIRKWMYTDHLISPEEHSNFIERLKEDNKNFYWLAKSKDAGSIGVIYLNRVDWGSQNAFLGIYANPENPAPGKGKELFKGLIHIAFDQAKLHTLKLEVFEDNERALGFYKKMGLAQEGRLKEFAFKNGQWKDIIIMGLVNPHTNPLKY